MSQQHPQTTQKTHVASPPLKAEFAATVVICAAYIAFLLWLPLFPTQDGPEHLFLVHAMSQIFSHPSGAYANFYTIKHLLPPYSLYYYALLALGKVLPLLLADRLILCFYVLLFVFGFRYLARSIGASADLMTLLVSPLLFCWPLVMGFINFCLSLSLAFWMLGLWSRSLGTRDLRRKAGVVCLAVVIMFVHPIPLILALVLMSLQSAVFAIGARRNIPTVRTPLLQDLLTLALVASTGLYIRLFTNANVLKQNKAVSIGKVFGERYYSLKHQGAISAFPETTRSLHVFHLALALIPIIGFTLAFLHLRDRGKASVAGRQWLLYASLAWMIYPFLPDQLNGSFYFADRFAVLLWIAPLLAASVSVIPRTPFRYVIVVIALGLNAATLLLARKYIRPVAMDLAQIEQLQPQWSGKVGLLLYGKEHKTAGLDYDPYQHSAAHFLRRNDAIWDNVPWLDLAIIPLGYRPSPITIPVTNVQREKPELLTEALIASPEKRAIVLSNVDFILIPAQQDDSSPSPYEVMRLDARSSWSCSLLPQTSLVLCKPTSKLPAQSASAAVP